MLSRGMVVLLMVCAACRPAAVGPEVTVTTAFAGRPVTGELTAPDGRWQVTGYGYGPNGELPVLEARGSRAFTHSGVPEVFQADGATLLPLAFAPDNSAVYFTLVPTLEPYFWYPYGAGLQRLDLGDGTVSEMLAYEGAYVHALSLSPDTTRLAFTRFLLYDGQSPVSLYLRDLADGAESLYVLPEGYTQGGGIVWSPDQRRLVLGLARTSVSWEEGSALVLVDLEADAVRVLTRQPDNVFIPISWLEDGIVRVRDFGARDEWQLEVDSGELRPSE